MTRRAACVLSAFIALVPIANAAPPVIAATNAGRGASVVVATAARSDTWTITVRTVPAGLPILVQPSVGRKQTATSPVTLQIRCHACPLSATAQLWLFGGKTLTTGGRLVHGRITVAIYRGRP